MPRVAGVGLLAIAFAAIVVPLLSTTSPLAISDVLNTRLVPPFSFDANGGFHLLGTDRFGRDMFARIMLAARISLAIGVLGSLFAAMLGILAGAASAWLGGIADRMIMGAADTLLSLPRIVLLLVCAALWSPGLAMMVVVLAATGWMGVARMVRAEVLGVRNQPYVSAAVALGTPSLEVLVRHALPNSLGPAIVATTLGVGNTILMEGGLSFLGLGVQPPNPSWGNMIAGGRDLIVTAPWVAIAPGLALVITVLCCTLLGDALRDRLTGRAQPTALQQNVAQ